MFYSKKIKELILANAELTKALKEQVDRHEFYLNVIAGYLQDHHELKEYINDLSKSDTSAG